MAALGADTGKVLHLERGRNQLAVEYLLQVIGLKVPTFISDFAPFMVKDQCFTVKPVGLTEVEQSHISSWLQEKDKWELYYLLQRVRYFLKF